MDWRTSRNLVTNWLSRNSNIANPVSNNKQISSLARKIQPLGWRLPHDMGRYIYNDF